MKNIKHTTANIVPATIYLPKAIKVAGQVAALQNDVTFSVFITAAVEAYLATLKICEVSE